MDFSGNFRIFKDFPGFFKYFPGYFWIFQDFLRIFRDTGRCVDEPQIDGSVADALRSIVTDAEGDGDESIETHPAAGIISGGRKRRIRKAGVIRVANASQQHHFVEFLRRKLRRGIGRVTRRKRQQRHVADQCRYVDGRRSARGFRTAGSQPARVAGCLQESHRFGNVALEAVQRRWSSFFFFVKIQIEI